MRRFSVAAVVALVMTPHPAVAQKGIPSSSAAAEAEGAAFPRHAAPPNVAPDFGRPFTGTVERKCVTPSATGNDAGGQVRSGEFIIRGLFAGRFGQKGAVDQMRNRLLGARSQLQSDFVSNGEGLLGTQN